MGHKIHPLNTTNHWTNPTKELFALFVKFSTLLTLNKSQHFGGQTVTRTVTPL